MPLHFFGTAGERDPFREIPLRYLGYANEVGEAFRYMIPLRLVHLSYGISSAYVMSHSVWCAKNSQPDQAPRLVKSPHEVSTTRKTAELSPAKAFLDTLIWQGLASVIVPGLFINRTCAVSRWIIYWLFRRQVNKSTRKWMVTGIGLGSIPFIIHPIDRTVDKFMDIYMRPLLFL